MLGTGKDNAIWSYLAANNMASGIYLNESIWSPLLVGCNKKHNRMTISDYNAKLVCRDHAINLKLHEFT